MKLGINIDHIATLRQARQEGIPDVIQAARECLAGGADGIVCHLREDRRHIQDRDVLELRKLNTRLDLEMAATAEMVRFALRIKPNMVTLVPEKRKELTTEGGLKVTKKLKPMIEKLQKNGILVSLFIDPVLQQVEEAAVVGAKFIELHTGEYANARTNEKRQHELERIGTATQKARLIGLRINAGHGLDCKNVKAIAGIPGIEELNIGFSVIARSVFTGLRKAVAEMREAMK